MYTRDTLFSCHNIYLLCMLVEINVKLHVHNNKYLISSLVKKLLQYLWLVHVLYAYIYAMCIMSNYRLTAFHFNFKRRCIVQPARQVPFFFIERSKQDFSLAQMAEWLARQDGFRRWLIQTPAVHSPVGAEVELQYRESLNLEN